MKIFVTGATGFLGSALVKRWSGPDHELHALARRSSSPEKLAALAEHARLHVVEGDDLGPLVAAIKPDAIVHTACAYGRNGESAIEILDTNVRLGLILLQGAIDRGDPCLFVNTGTSLPATASRYALSKHQFSDWAVELTRSASGGGTKLADVRLEYLYGPGDSEQKFPALVVGTCQRDEPELLLTGCEQQRDFVFIDDVVDAYDHLLHCVPALSRIERLPLGSGEAVALRAFVEAVHATTRSTTCLRFGALPYRTGEAQRQVADLARWRQLGWAPKFDLGRGLSAWLNPLDRTPSRAR